MTRKSMMMVVCLFSVALFAQTDDVLSLQDAIALYEDDGIVTHRGHGVIELIKELVATDINASNPNDNNYTALMYASEHGYTDIVKALIAEGADIDAKHKYGSTALEFAAQRGQIPIVKVLIEAGADIESKDNNGNTILIEVAVYGRKHRTEVVKLLIEAGANLETEGFKGWTALIRAAQGGHTEEVKLLIEAGANLETEGNSYTALMYAAEDGYIETVIFLIDAGANIDAQNYYGQTALFLAVYRGRTDVAKFLIEAGADVNESSGGRTALMKTAEYWQTEMAKALIAAGANLDVQDSDGNTALMYAAQYGSTEIVEAFIEAGANIHIQDNDGNTASTMAFGMGYKSIANVIKAAAAQLPYTATESTVRSLDYRQVIFGNTYQNIIEIDANAFFAQYPQIKKSYSAGGYYESDTSYDLSETNYDHVYEQVIGETTLYRVVLSHDELTDADFDDWREVRFTQYVFLKKSDTDLLQLGESYEFGLRNAPMQYESDIEYTGLEIIARNNQVIGIMKYTLFNDYHWGGMDGPGRTVAHNKAFYYAWSDIMQSESELVPTITHFTLTENPAITITSTDPLVDNRRPFMYTIQNVFDGNPATSFVEYTKDNLMSIHFEFPSDHTFTDIALINGYAQDESMYSSNNRGKTITFPETSTGNAATYNLDGNTLGYQEFSLKNPITQSSVTMDVTEIYNGTKYSDSCLAEFDIY